MLHNADPPVFHLDLNPGNIRLTENGIPVITDFGVAYVEEPRLIELTMLPQVHPGLTAPEQYAGEKPDERTDIYQLGSLLCWMLVGHFPNMGGIPVLVASNEVDQYLKETIIQCVSANREQRFQDVESLKEALAIIPSLGERTKNALIGAVPPWRRRGIVTAGFLVAIFAAAWVAGLLPPYGPIEITIASSSTKKEWIVDSVKLFNEQSIKQWDLQHRRDQFQVFGRPVHVTVILEEIEPGEWVHYRSGQMVKDLLNGKIKPTIASPADAKWVANIVRDWPVSISRRVSQGDMSIMKSEPKDLLRTPLVLAMWVSRAEALGCWPEAGPSCTWRSIVELVSDSDGWSTVGHPEWPTPTVGYATVGRSNSATFMAMLVCLSGLQDPSDATLDEISDDGGCGQAITDYLSADTINRISSTRVLEEMRERGPGYLDFVTTYETELVEISLIWEDTLPEAMVSVYPQDGTTDSTHPFAVLDEAPWVSDNQANAAIVFRDFLLNHEQQESLIRHGLRPISLDVPIGPPIDIDHGANPDVELIYPVITQDMLSQVVRVWEKVKSANRQ